MDAVLALDIDGWKCDGTDPFMLEYVEAHGACALLLCVSVVKPRPALNIACFLSGYQGKVVSYRDYADAYYGDFNNYTRQKLGDDRLIMSRPVDGDPPVSIPSYVRLNPLDSPLLYYRC